MTAISHRETAKIYEFPKRVRPATGLRHDEVTLAADITSSRYSDAAYGSSWYHEAALIEVEPSRKP
jgi:hypothetical protein